jgi:cell division protein FtsL
MAVAATKTAPRASVTERQQHRVVPPISRRYRKRRGVILARTVLCTLAMVSLLGYIGLYAQVTIYGYKRADLSRSMRQIEMENQALRAEIQTLSSPDRLSAVATASGMTPSSEVVYISTQGDVRVARAD